MASLSERVAAALSAEGDELWQALRAQHPDVFLSALSNRNLTEDMALFIVGSKAAPPEVLGTLASDARFKDSYRLKLAMVKNPRSPRRISVSFLKYMRVFDVADLTRNNFIPAVLKQKAEFLLMEKMPAMASGVKIALSRRASGRVVERLMEKSDRRVIEACLESPRLTEEQLYKMAGRQSAKPLIIRAIAEHPLWSLRYSIRYALLRNYHTPMIRVEEFIEGMKSNDLRELYSDPAIPLSTRPFIFRELGKRDEPLEVEGEEVFEISEEEAESSSYGDWQVEDGE
jgi:hypothetical protein